MSASLTLLRPQRSAHASIRGYLYQACLGVERWLALDENEALLCEGDEDLDRLIRGAGTDSDKGTSEQIKDLTGDAQPKVVRDTLRNFLWAWVTLRQRGETRRFVFTTTANLRSPGKRPRELDILQKWHEEEACEEVTEAVRRWVLHPSTPEEEKLQVEKAVVWLDEDAARWTAFFGSVSWRFGEPGIEQSRRTIADKLTGRGLPTDDFAVDRLVWEVLAASAQRDPAERVLDEARCDEVLAEIQTGLDKWAAQPRIQRLRAVLTDAERLQGVLWSGELHLEDIPEDRRVPSQLLQAAYQVVPFEGRGEELEEVLDWCNDGRLASVQLWFGPGGTGKSRLWIEACRRLRHQGWLAGFLGTAEVPSALFSGVVPRLVVIDYAETRLPQVRPLLERLATHQSAPKVCVVLLAREAAGWWEELGKADTRIEHLVHVSPRPRKISALAPTRDLRKSGFTAAVEAFAETLDRVVPEGMEIPSVLDKVPDRTLYLHMTALLTVQGEAPTTAPALLQGILDHERRFWHKELQAKRLTDIDIAEVETAVAGLVLRGGASDWQDALTAVGLCLDLSPNEPAVRSLVRILHELYERPEGLYIEPLQPDLLGEALVDVALDRELNLLGRVLEEAEDKVRERLLTVLTRLAQQEGTATGQDGKRWLEAALARDLDRLAEPALRVILETGEPLAEMLSAAIEGSKSQELVDRLVELFDADRGRRVAVPLRRVAVSCDKRALAFLQQSAAVDRAAIARRLIKLSADLANIGRDRDGLEAAREAVGICQELVQSRPTDFLPDLAKSLHTLGARLGGLNQPEAAQEATKKAVKIWRDLADPQLERFRPELADSLLNLGLWLHTLEQDEEAIVLLEEAVSIYRELVARNKPRYLADLAQGLHNLGIPLIELRRYRDAVEVTQDAAGIRKALMQEDPAVFSPAYAMSVSNLGYPLFGLGREEEALKASAEAVEAYRELGHQQPDVFLPHLARSLRDYAYLLASTRRKSGLPDCEEAMRVLLPFFRKMPQVHADRMEVFRSTYLKLAEAAGQKLDVGLLTEIEEIFQQLDRQEET